jgi:hypothetical protein
MFANTSAEILLNTQSRCITSVYDKKIHRFIVGTAASTSQQQETITSASSSCLNPLQILRYHEDMNELIMDSQVDFGENGGSGEVWSISSCPFDSKLVMVCRDGLDRTPETGLWRIPQDAMKDEEEEDLDYYSNDYDGRKRLEESNHKIEDVNRSMEKVAVLQIDSTLSDCGILTNRVTDMHWNPQCYRDPEDTMLGDMNLVESTMSSSNSNINDAPFNFMTVHKESHHKVTVATWNISDMTPTLAHPVEKFEIPIPSGRGVLPNPPKASWDPHNTHMCAVTLGTNIAIVDFRTPSKVVNGLKSCHRLGVMDVDYNSVKPMVLCSSGQDSLIKFWDLRFTSSYYTNDQPTQNSGDIADWSIHQPLKIIRGGHTHWANVVKYNSFHDQLILSGGTDGICNLWRMSSISSAPLTDLATTGDVHDFELDDKDHPGSSTSFDKDEYRNSHEDDNVHDDENSTDTTSQGEEYNPDVRVSQMEMREAIYDVTWSATDPWIYVTLGFDGNVVLNHVPSKEKYKILL